MTAESFVDSYNEQFGNKRINKVVDELFKKRHPHTLDDVVKYVFKNFTVYMVSFDEINFAGTNITASRVGLCAPDITLSESNIDVSARGCKSMKGLG